MDLISHGLWGGLVLGRKRGFWWAALFGMLPDIIAFAPCLALRAVQGGVLSVFTRPKSYPEWVHLMYNSSHSLVVAGLLFTALWAWRRDLGILFLAWPMHILLDIPTHSANCFPTKFLFPLCHLYFDGVHWHNGYILAGNWIAITLAYFIYGKHRKRVMSPSDYRKT